MDKGKSILWKLLVKCIKFLFSGAVTLIGLVELLMKMKGDDRR